MKTQLDTGDGCSPSLLKVVPNNTSSLMPYRVILLCATLSLLLGCTLGDDESHLDDIQSELNQNRKKWTSAMVSNYELNFRWKCGLCYDEPVSISVHESRIVDIAVMVKDSRFLNEPPDYHTVDGLFDFMQEGIDMKADTLSAEYHSELGYPIDVWIDYEIGGIDDEIGFEINGLRIK